MIAVETFMSRFKPNFTFKKKRNKSKSTYEVDTRIKKRH